MLVPISWDPEICFTVSSIQPNENKLNLESKTIDKYSQKYDIPVIDYPLSILIISVTNHEQTGEVPPAARSPHNVAQLCLTVRGETYLGNQCEAWRG